MSVNLKLRKSAQSEQEAPAPELVMAGGQTPWGPTPTTPPPSGNPFADADGYPAAPPPPPPFGLEDDPDAGAPSGRKVNPKLLAAAVAVVVALGGGYFALNSGSGSGSGSTSTADSALAAAKARAAAARAKAAGTAKTTTVKPAGTGAKAALPAKTVAPAKTPAKAATKASTKPKAKAATEPGTVMHAALPGQIGRWSKLIIAKAPASLVKYDPSIGTSLTNVQTGWYGGTVANPVTLVVVADHPAKAKLSALKLLRQELPDLRAAGFVVAAPEAVTAPLFSGTSACTTLTRNDILGVACMWADTGTFGFTIVAHTAGSQKIDILDTIRASVEH